MVSLQEYLAAAARANAEAQIGMMMAIAGKACERLGKTIDLDVRAAKNAIDEAVPAFQPLNLP